MKYFASKLSDNISKTPEGFLVCLGVSAGRTGPMEYGEGETPLDPGDDGIVRIDRDEDEVFNPATLASFEGKPLTIGHPQDFVNPQNWRQLAQGHIQNVRRGAGDQKDDMICDVIIKSAQAISEVENGLRGLSFGYEAEYVETGKGKGKQTKIRGNHLALVEEGRAGDQYRINDSKKGDRSMSTDKKKLVEKLNGVFDSLTKTLDSVFKDEDAPPKKDEPKDEGMKGLDELVKVCNALMEKLDGMKPAAKDAPPKKDDPPAAKDEDEGMEALQAKIKELEAKLAEYEEVESGDEDVDPEAIADEDMDGEGEDEDMPGVVGDEKTEIASRAEILAPGIKQTKDVKKEALKSYYGTKDGKTALEKLSGGKAPKFESKEVVDHLFIAASELAKATRRDSMARSKSAKAGDANLFSFGASEMTIEKQNELNEKFYNKKAQ